MSLSPEDQAILNAAKQLLSETDSCMWIDNATHFNCTEADYIAELLRAYGLPGTADEFIAEHATDDDAGDVHHPDHGAYLLDVANGGQE